jgi:hypothetical protein
MHALVHTYGIGIGEEKLLSALSTVGGDMRLERVEDAKQVLVREKNFNIAYVLSYVRTYSSQ